MNRWALLVSLHIDACRKLFFLLGWEPSHYAEFGPWWTNQIHWSQFKHGRRFEQKPSHTKLTLLLKTQILMFRVLIALQGFMISSTAEVYQGGMHLSLSEANYNFSYSRPIQYHPLPSSIAQTPTQHSRSSLLCQTVALTRQTQTRNCKIQRHHHTSKLSCIQQGSKTCTVHGTTWTIATWIIECPNCWTFKGFVRTQKQGRVAACRVRDPFLSTKTSVLSTSCSSSSCPAFSAFGEWNQWDQNARNSSWKKVLFQESIQCQIILGTSSVRCFRQ